MVSIVRLTLEAGVAKNRGSEFVLGIKCKVKGTSSTFSVYEMFNMSSPLEYEIDYNLIIRLLIWNMAIKLSYASRGSGGYTLSFNWKLFS